MASNCDTKLAGLLKTTAIHSLVCHEKACEDPIISIVNFQLLVAREERV
jgi:hypothetical protein